MARTYDVDDQRARLRAMIEMGEVRLRRLSVDQVIERGAEMVAPLTDETLTEWFQKGWDHYLFDLRGSSVRPAVDLFRKVA